VSIRFHQEANAAKAAAAKAYLRNQFEFFGIATPARRAICKEYMRSHLPEYHELSQIIHELWELPQREYQYFAVELLAVFRKQWQENIIVLAEYLIIHKSWWDTVDHIASEITGPYFKQFPGQAKRITLKWNRSKNIWLQRSSIMFQKSYKKETDTEILSRYILHVRDSKEFFIQKAIGWALREYSKANEKWVKYFVKKNALPPLSKREALKRIDL